MISEGLRHRNPRVVYASGRLSAIQSRLTRPCIQVGTGTSRSLDSKVKPERRPQVIHTMRLVSADMRVSIQNSLHEDPNFSRRQQRQTLSRETLRQAQLRAHPPLLEVMTGSHTTWRGENPRMFCRKVYRVSNASAPFAVRLACDVAVRRTQRYRK